MVLFQTGALETEARVICGLTGTDPSAFKEIVQTHLPDGSSVDSKAIICIVEDVMNHGDLSTLPVPEATTKVSIPHRMQTVQIHGSVGQTLYKLSHEVMRRCSMDQSPHAITMALLDSLGNYPCDGKVVLVLASFAITYGEFMLVTQLYPSNPLAASIATFKHACRYLEDNKILKTYFKPLHCLAKTSVNVARCIIEFESLPVKYITLNLEALASSKRLVHLGTYWVIRSVIACFSLITLVTTRSHDQAIVSKVSVVWELWSLFYKVKQIYDQFRAQLNAWEKYIEWKLEESLAHLFESPYVDNQEVLQTLFSVKQGPLVQRACSQGEFDLDILRNKFIILLISKLDIPPKKLLYLVKQTYDPDKVESSRSYEVVWIPFPGSISWTHEEERVFLELRCGLPWFSLCQPWLLRQPVENYMKETWHFNRDPVMVVLDHWGKICSTNAIDMVTIWGDLAYPFSTSREKELWENTNWSLQLILDEIDPLLLIWMEQGRTICVYGGNTQEWTTEFCTRMRRVKNAGVALELLYVGTSRSQVQPGREFLDTIVEEKLGIYLSETKAYFFWVRLMSMRSSRSRLGKDAETDSIMKELVSLLNHDERGETWALIGEGSSPGILSLEGRRFTELLGLCHMWEDKAKQVGFMNTMRGAVEPSTN